jgi:hypothetical protein
MEHLVMAVLAKPLRAPRRALQMPNHDLSFIAFLSRLSLGKIA